MLQKYTEKKINYWIARAIFPLDCLNSWVTWFASFPSLKKKKPFLRPWAHRLIAKSKNVEDRIYILMKAENGICHNVYIFSHQYFDYSCGASQMACRKLIPRESPSHMQSRMTSWQLSKPALNMTLRRKNALLVYLLSRSALSRTLPASPQP